MKLTPFIKSENIIAPKDLFVNRFRNKLSSRVGAYPIQLSIQRMIRSAADQMREITPIISNVGTAKIAMIPKAIANIPFDRILLMLPCRFCNSFIFIEVFTCHLKGAGKIK